MTPTELARSLSRHAPKNARIQHESSSPFGHALQVDTWSLGNGLRILTMEDRSAPVVSYQTWFGVGSRHEVQGKTGLAHFFEHLMFNATTQHPQGEFDRMLESVGVENNAATWTDWTYYYETLPAKELPLVAELEADRMENLDLQPQTIASEQEVVASERRDRIDDDVEGKASETLYAKALTKHPYRWPTLGWMRDIRGYTQADCEAFYRRHYSPNNATLVIAGELELRTTLELVQARYGHMKRSRRAPEPALRLPNQRTERRVELAQPTYADKLCLGQRAPSVKDPDWIALAVLGDVLFGGRQSRVHRELVQDTELASEVYGSVAPFALPGLYEVWVGLREGHAAEEALAAVDAAFARVMETPVSDDELERAKSRVELELLASVETINGKAEQVGFDQMVLENPTAMFGQLAAYRALSPHDLQRVAQRYLQPSTRTSVLVRASA